MMYAKIDIPRLRIREICSQIGPTGPQSGSWMLHESIRDIRGPFGGLEDIEQAVTIDRTRMSSYRGKADRS
jgi:hypothetical protein